MSTHSEEEEIQPLETFRHKQSTERIVHQQNEPVAKRDRYYFYEDLSENNMPNGKGKIIYADGIVYESDFMYVKRHAWKKYL